MFKIERLGFINELIHNLNQINTPVMTILYISVFGGLSVKGYPKVVFVLISLCI